MSRKKFLLVISNILRLLINTFTADEMCSPLNRDSLTQTIHMILSQYKKMFLEFFWHLKSILSLEHFFKKNDPHS